MLLHKMKKKMKTPICSLILFIIGMVVLGNNCHTCYHTSTHEDLDSIRKEQISPVDMDDFEKSILDTRFFYEEISSAHQYCILVHFIARHIDEQYDEGVAEELYQMLKKYPNKIEPIKKEIENKYHNTALIYENLYKMIMSAYVLNHTNTCTIDSFYTLLPFVQRTEKRDSILQCLINEYDN